MCLSTMGCDQFDLTWTTSFYHLSQGTTVSNLVLHFFLMCHAARKNGNYWLFPGAQGGPLLRKIPKSTHVVLLGKSAG